MRHCGARVLRRWYPKAGPGHGPKCRVGLITRTASVEAYSKKRTDDGDDYTILYYTEYGVRGTRHDNERVMKTLDLHIHAVLYMYMYMTFFFFFCKSSFGIIRYLNMDGK